MPPLDPGTLAGLYRQHAAALRLYARQWGEHAEDIVQDAFVRLAQQGPPPESAVPWLYRVVRNEAVSAGRRAWRRRRREQACSAGESWFASVDEQLDAQQATRLLAEVSLASREIIIARIWGGLTFAEIATLVGSSLPTVHRQYQSGLAELKEKLDGRARKAGLGADIA